ncbi:MAG: lactate utilization protein [Bryobacteraceae bacterium]
MTSREQMLGQIRSALGRTAGQAPPPVPAPLIRVPEVPLAAKVEKFCKALEALNGKAYVANSREDARAYAERLLAGRHAVASNAPFLAECGITAIPGVSSGLSDRLALRQLCAELPLGISSADYALAETGSLVMISSHEEARLVSLLPPCHLAVVPKERLLSGLDELLTILPKPAERSSSMVFITGPSRTADIEQFLVRGVHGPGEIHVVLV